MHEAPDPNTNIEDMSITPNTPQDLYLEQKDLIDVYWGLEIHGSISKKP